MDILINDFASNCSLNYFEVKMIEEGKVIASYKPLIFIEVIFRINSLVLSCNLKDEDIIIYKLYNEQNVESHTILITIGKFRGQKTTNKQEKL
ncbi:hypothetical protein [Bacillus sp. JJ1764]|uniref:hypothetical protein n=1 Tax=Bacillus sp. JJ1764 TaxID=3122964 RepID=UPI003000C4CC